MEASIIAKKFAENIIENSFNPNKINIIMFENIKSKLGTLQLNDFSKGAILTVIVALLTVIQQSLQNNVNIDWNVVFNASLTALVAYLLKNISTNSQGKFLGKEPEE